MSLKSKNNFLAKIIIFIWIVLFVFSLFGLVVEASSEVLEPGPDQYLELKAKTIQEKNGSKQLIMELWGYKLEFSGFDVRFKYDTEALQLSNVDTNAPTTDETEFFKFESEFDGKLDFWNKSPVLNEGDNIIHPKVSFTWSDFEVSEHIKKATDKRNESGNRRCSFIRKIKF